MMIYLKLVKLLVKRDISNSITILHCPDKPFLPQALIYRKLSRNIYFGTGYGFCKAFRYYEDPISKSFGNDEISLTMESGESLSFKGTL